MPILIQNSKKNWLSVSIVLLKLCDIAFGLFDNCNHMLELNANQKIYINSPYYPSSYPIGTSCRYSVQAPLDYGLRFRCDINFYTPLAATRCQNEIFYFNREGSELLSGSEYFCGSGTMERKSFLNRAVISYISTLPTSSSNRYYNRNLPKATTSKTGGDIFSSDSHMENGSVATRKRTKINRTVTTTTAPATTTSDGVEVLSATAEVGASNAFAYVLAIFSNNYHKTISIPTPTTTSTSTSSTIPISIREISKVLPSITWHNITLSSSVTNSTSSSSTSASTRQHARIIVNQPDGVNSLGDGSSSSSSSTGGGGTFSCLVEVVEPECECGWSMPTNVASGIDDRTSVASVNEFPSMAGVLTLRSKKIFCGATIIHHRYLMSAAHCFISALTGRPELIGIIVGEYDVTTVLESFYTRIYDIEAIIPHERFHSTANSVRNDIALLRTRRPIEWNRAVGPVCLPFRVGEQKLPMAGQRLDAVGWGTTTFGGPQSSRLRKTSLDVISTAECRRALLFVPPASFCTYTPGHDTCQYDSGGALYARDERLYAIGIVSYGFACATSKPSVNMRVASFAKWIRSKTPDVKYCIK